ncbi:MAG: hypothetical protein HYT93_04655 [Parcubacteria group bacterium]|nr:hypothetical protein [Parcubacteria group bacterium]
MINIEYDNEQISEGDIQALSKAVRDIVSEVTGIEDVFTYTNSAHIKVKIAPVEIFVRMSAQKIKDADKLIKELKLKLTDWKQSTDFKYPINLTLIPMEWKIEIGI